MTRKDRRAYLWLLTLFLWYACPPQALVYPLFPTAHAQTFDPLPIEQSLVGTVEDGSATPEQWESLQQASIEAFLATPSAQVTLNQTFNPDGVFGEIIDGSVMGSTSINDTHSWETLAKAMGTTATILVGAYSLWRNQRREELSKLRNGDTAQIEAMFENAFGSGRSDLGDQTPSTAHHDQGATPPSTTAQWQDWTAKRGIPGAGAALAALFAIWKRKQDVPDQLGLDQESYEYLQTHYQAGQSFSEFSRTVSQARSTNEAARYQELMDEAGLIMPTAPERSEAQKIFEYIKNKGGRSATEAGYRSANYNLPKLPRYLSNPEATKNKLNQILFQLQISYAAQSQGHRPRYNHYSPRYGLAKFQSALNRYREQMGEEIYQEFYQKSLTIETDSKALYEEGEQDHHDYTANYAQYKLDRTAYYKQSNDFRTKARAFFTNISRNVRDYWNLADQAQNHDNLWAESLKEFADQTAQGLAAKAQAKKVQFDDLLGHLMSQENLETGQALLETPTEFDPYYAQTESDFVAAKEAEFQAQAEEAYHKHRKERAWLYTLSGGKSPLYTKSLSEFTSSYRQRHKFDQNLTEQLTTWQTEKRNYQLQRIASGEIRFDTDPTTLFAEEADQAIQAQKVSEYKDLQALIPNLNRVKSFMAQLGANASRSVYFSDLKAGLQNQSSLEAQIEALVRTPSPYAEKIAQLEAKLAQSNELTVQERLNRMTTAQQAHHKKRGLNRLENDMMRDRREALANENHYASKLAKHLHSALATRGGYSEAYEATLRDLADKAAKAEEHRLQGWQDLWKTHPDLWAEQQKNRHAELKLLKEQEAQYLASLQAEKEQIIAQKEQSLSQAYESYQWLNQNAEERSINDLTRTILDSELAPLARSGASIANKLTNAAQFAAHRAALLLVHQDAQENLKTANQSLNELHQGRFHQALDRTIATLKYFATPEGKAKTDSIFHQEAVEHWRKKAAAYNQEHGTDISANDLAKAYHGIKASSGTSIKNQVDNLGQINSQSDTKTSSQPDQVNQHGEIDTRTSVQLVEAFEGVSSENPDSIKQFQALLAQKEAAEQERVIAEAERIVEAAREEAYTQKKTQLEKEVFDWGHKPSEETNPQSISEPNTAGTSAINQFVHQWIIEEKAKASRVKNQLTSFIDALDETQLQALFQNQASPSLKDKLIAPLLESSDNSLDSLKAFLQGQQSYTRTQDQILGHASGGIASVGEEILAHIGHKALQAIGWDDELQTLINALMGSQAGKVILQALEQGEAGMSWLETNHPSIALDLKGLIGQGKLATLFAGGVGAKHSFKALKPTLAQIQRQLQVIKFETAKLGVVLQKLDWNIDPNGQLNYAFQTADGQGFNLPSNLVDNFDFETNVQKSSGNSGGVGGLNSLTSLSQSFSNPKNITEAAVEQLLKLSEKKLGHTLDIHIDLSSDQLKARLNDLKSKNTDRNPADFAPKTSFRDRVTANKAIAEALRSSEGQKFVKEVLHQSKQGAMRMPEGLDSIQIPTSINLGKGFKFSPSGEHISLEGLREIYIALKPNGQGGFQIITSFPTP